MIKTVLVSEAKAGTTKSNAPFFTIKGSSGTESVSGNCFDPKCAGVLGKSVDFEVVQNGTYTNLTLVQIHEGPVQSAAPEVSSATNNKGIALMAACTAVAGRTDVTSDQTLLVADKFVEWLS